LDGAGVTAVRRLAGVAVAVGLCLAALRALFPAPEVREPASYAFVLTLGYGHLLGGLVGGRRAFAAALPAPLGTRSGLVLLAASTPLLLLGYRAALLAWPPVLWLLLAVSTWHVCENECALAGARGGRLGRVRGSWREQLLPVLTTGSVLLAAASVLPQPERAALAPFAAALPGPAERGIAFSDVFTGVTLFHLLSWLAVTLPRAPRLVLGVHVAGAAVCGAILASPGELALRAREVVFSPGLYLFWSALHVVQTALGRSARARE
jgi:hypothetical protein